MPQSQKGFLKKRNILHHIIHAKGIWDDASNAAFPSIDFAKAHESASHTFFEAPFLKQPSSFWECQMTSVTC